nr:uncharacterized protein LOC121122292 [Lepeophtheirus salmonis]
MRQLPVTSYKKTKLKPYQKGIIISSKSLTNLHVDLTSQNTTIEYILSARCNQDIIEKIFLRIRGTRRFHQHPNSVEFKDRFRILVISNSSQFAVSTAVVKCQLETASYDSSIFDQIKSTLHEISLVDEPEENNYDEDDIDIRNDIQLLLEEGEVIAEDPNIYEYDNCNYEDKDIDDILEDEGKKIKDDELLDPSKECEKEAFTNISLDFWQINFIKNFHVSVQRQNI